MICISPSELAKFIRRHKEAWSVKRAKQKTVLIPKSGSREKGMII